ncbi:P1 family peptidase [Peristeroidobacter soli]|jgi:L-aminopeptidase/D-esterase-like protein|uniref:P1 family peptidase n=1 Tax=Peristeroidobacter soli TaxID=2497877 RepID=UPI00101DD4C8|nr:P1 family peptidase [Peristeroidobacter soli]
MIVRRSLLIALAVTATLSGVARAADDQSSLQPVLNAGDNVLKFDWPAVSVGTGEYEEGPTGVTVFRFDRRVHAAVDVRGGGPGTVNTDYLRIGYEVPEVDSVVFSGGSWYGLESTTAVATALKDDHIRDGIWTNLALSVGAIIYDFGDRRLNEIYPDKRLAQAAARAARPGMFPLGAHGAGRMAKTGHIFDCGAYSGQGGAFKQIGDLKIAAFTVVNAVGVVTDREGRVAACYRDKDWPQGELKTAELFSAFPASSQQGAWRPMAQKLDAKRNTTVSLVITNQKLDRARLERLATQVHSSMGRALQPFATELDGDVLYAVSTAELQGPVDESPTPNVDLDIIASELMWDAVLASIPAQQPIRQPDPNVTFSTAQLRVFAGEYVFSNNVSVRVTVEGNKLMAQASGARAAFAVRKETVELLPASKTEFVVPGRYPTTLSFAGKGKLVLNPGHWQQVGSRRK